MSEPLNITEILAQPSGGVVGVTMIGHGSTGVISYSRGELTHKPSDSYGHIRRSPNLASERNGLITLFSDRMRIVDPTEGFGSIARQPFDVDQADRIGLTIYETGFRRMGEPYHRYGATLKFLSWSGGRLSVPLVENGDFLIGVTTKVNGSETAFTIAFFKLPPPLR